MKITYLKSTCVLWFVLAIMSINAELQSADPNYYDPNSTSINLANKTSAFGEMPYWPRLDRKEVQSFITKSAPKDKKCFVRFVNQIINPNYLPKNLSNKIYYLKGWRGKDHKNFIMQYEKGPYVIRFKNQMTKVVADRVWKSYWFVMIIQRKDHGVCVDKKDINGIFAFTDQFLGKKINSKAQNYSGVQNMDGTKMRNPRFQKIDDGYHLIYPVGASRPDIDAVSIWTDGRTVIINMQERRKMSLDGNFPKPKTITDINSRKPKPRPR